jgi:hypothetical protein
MHKRSASITIKVSEGNICPTLCAAAGSFVGNFMFGDQPATLYNVFGAYVLFVGSIGKPTYMMQGGGMTQAQFVAWAAALKKVPKA